MKFKNIFIIFFLIMVFGCLGIKSNINLEEEIVDVKEIYKENYLQTIKEKYDNEDIVGIINIKGTDINEVILQGNDNEYYLNHNIYKKYDIKGSVYLDYRVDINNSKKKIIYSHNSSNLKVPFKTLDNYYDYDYYKEHSFIDIITEDNVLQYQIFSVYVETSDWDYMNTQFTDDSDWYRHLVKLKNKSIYDTEVTIDKDDDILILQTCSLSKEYKKYKNKYLLVIAKKNSKSSDLLFNY